ncbi:ATP synthase F1 subunit delta [Anaerolineales bacterium HSG6]|nr:ATP synthase F1 subunit delta [Anaerolineales bacterium HSG6]MDM8530314.1 ATP synthase F1 subunit delta [Anaerolineales bacterium HSG25]
MNVQELSRKYAYAVFSHALEDWLTVLGAVQSSLSSNSGLSEKLQNASLTFSEKQAAIDEVIPQDCSQPTRNFLYMLVREGDVGLLNEITSDLDRMSTGGTQVQVAYVTTAVELSDNDKDKFRQKLSSQYGDNLDFVFRIDTTILGGAIIQIGDKLIDGSVATRLNTMSNALGVKA